MNYEATPHTAETTISQEEMDAIVADECRSVAKDRKKLMHLAGRMSVTIASFRKQIKGLNHEMQQMQIRQERVGQPTTLHPRDAVRFLAPEVLSELVEGHLRDRIGAVQKALGDAQKFIQMASRELSQVRYATKVILEDRSIPVEVRQRIRYLMDQLPEGVEVPPGMPMDDSFATGPAPLQQAPARQASEDLDGLFG